MFETVSIKFYYDLRVSAHKKEKKNIFVATVKLALIFDVYSVFNF